MDASKKRLGALISNIARRHFWGAVTCAATTWSEHTSTTGVLDFNLDFIAHAKILFVLPFDYQRSFELYGILLKNIVPHISLCNSHKRLLKRASTLKEQRPVRSSEALSAGPERRGLGRAAVTPAAVWTGHRGSPQRVTTRVKVTSPASRSLCGLHSSVIIKTQEVQSTPCLSWGFSFVSLHERCGAMSLRRTAVKCMCVHNK